MRLAPLVLLVSCTLLATPLRAQEGRFDQVTLEAVVEAGGQTDADALLQLWSKKLGVTIFIDQQMAGTKIKHLNSSTSMTWGGFKKVLDFYDIVIDEKEVVGQTILFAHLRRNFPAKVGPPFRTVTVEEAAKRPDEVVTALIPIKHGSGNDIFATVRGLLVRDVNRIGNILYVRGPEMIIIVDFGMNVSYYASVIRALDAPGAFVKVFDLQHGNADDTAVALEPLLEPGSKVISSPRTNQVIIRGNAGEAARLGEIIAKIDVPSGVQRPRFKADTMGIALWKIATAFAVVAFIGQTVLLRRFQRRALLTKLSP